MIAVAVIFYWLSPNIFIRFMTILVDDYISYCIIMGYMALTFFYYLT